MPNEKEKKYDRQLRLWGNHGQQALEDSQICLLNATATGTEIMKNLVLPGIGGFTIVDNDVVSMQDVGNNFFLTEDFIGSTKAQAATKLLKELNPDVKGVAAEESLATLLEKDPEYLCKFSIVIACDVEEDTLLSLSNKLWEKNIPLMVCISYGAIGYMRLVFKEMCVVETHPDNYFEDFRLLNPFPELCEYLKTIDIDALDSKGHSHVPYLVLLHKYLEEWKEQNGGEPPKVYKEKKKFAAFLMSKRRKNDKGACLDEENFEEAYKSVNTALVDVAVPRDVKEILEHENCTNLNSDSKPFWVLCQALKRFVDEHQTLPLSGSLPDMFSDSASYIKLQNVYQNKAKQDMICLMDNVSKVYADLGCIYDNGRMSEAEIKRFCRNSRLLKVVRTKSLEVEYRQTAPSDDVTQSFHDNTSDILWYVALRAAQKFRKEQRRFPGIETLEGDLKPLKDCSDKLAGSWGVHQVQLAALDDRLHEICRYGGAELHAIASFLGGVAAQEAIKLLTHQYVPVVDALIYDGIKPSTTAFRV